MGDVVIFEPQHERFNRHFLGSSSGTHDKSRGLIGSKNWIQGL